MKHEYRASAATLAKRRDMWLKKLTQLGPIVRGSLVSAQRGNHLAHQLTVSVKGKTHTVYVPPGMVKEVKQWIKNYRRMQRIVKDVSKLSMAIIHRHVPESQGVGRSAGSPRRRR